MKKLSCATILITLLVLISHSSLFAQGNLKVGGGLAWGSDAKAIGIQGGATYGFTDKFKAAGDFILFFPDNADHFELNANVHYGFHSQNNINIYGLGGLNFTSIDAGFRDDEEIGLNLGAGAEIGLDFAKAYSELKFIVGDADQVVLTGGLRFPL